MHLHVCGLFFTELLRITHETLLIATTGTVTHQQQTVTVGYLLPLTHNDLVLIRALPQRMQDAATHQNHILHRWNEALKSKQTFETVMLTESKCYCKCIHLLSYPFCMR